MNQHIGAPVENSSSQMSFYYHNEKNEPWHIAAASERDDILATLQPRYVTALDTDLKVPEGGNPSRDAAAAAKYRGDFYADWDSPTDLQLAITKVNQFLDRLESFGVDLNSIRLYCTGSKGFHAEIPAATFMEQLPEQGIVALPEIYKEMMYELYVETMDTNVYSEKRGRMWRRPQIRRENGKYKVPVPVEEIRSLTVERYHALVSSPQPEPKWNPPSYCPALAEVFRQAVGKVTERRGTRRGPSKTAGRSGDMRCSDGTSSVARAIRTVADAALERIDILLSTWFPDGGWEGANYVALNPRRNDKNPGSFKIHEDGYWIDYAHDSHKGGDLVALKRFVDGDSYNMLEAARRLADEIGLPFPDIDNDTSSSSSSTDDGISTSCDRSQPGASCSSAPQSLSGANREPVIINAIDLLAEELPPVRWIVPGLLPEGLSLLAGSPKIGKSWLALEVVVAVASGDTCLGGIQTMPGRALYLALEDNKRRLKERITLLLGKGGRPLPEKMELAIDWPRLDQGGLEKLDVWLSQHRDARLVVIDTLAKVRKKQSGNSNLYAEDYAVGEGLIKLAARHRVAIVLVTHVRKAESQDPLEMVTGTLGLTGGMDGILVLKRERGQGTASLYVTGRDVPEDRSYGLTWNKDTCRWTIEGDAKSLQMSEARKEIIALLARERRPLSAQDIATLSGRKHDATRRLLPDMVKDGLIEDIKDGRRWLFAHPLYSQAPISHPDGGTTTSLSPHSAPSQSVPDSAALRALRDGSARCAA